MSISVALIDDHAIFREGLCAVLANVPDVSVTAAAGDARAGYEVVDAKNPTVVVLDLALPGIGGLTVARELVRREPARKILVLSAHDEEDFVLQAMLAGAKGYACKSQPSAEIVEAIRTIAAGGSYLPPKISRDAIAQRLRQIRSVNPGSPTDSLSPREQDVFDLIVRGFGNEGIAAQLHISPKTVDTHRSHIFGKLGVHSSVDLIRFAARHRLICD
jgi:two-component system response regulator NreC